jgi:hypothetical protein
MTDANLAADAVAGELPVADHPADSLPRNAKPNGDRCDRH